MEQSKNYSAMDLPCGIRSSFKVDQLSNKEEYRQEKYRQWLEGTEVTSAP
ncbi:hypothetical protein [Rufibacter ruber]|nr:hypothetical protein [Rufibacter ruber]